MSAVPRRSKLKAKLVPDPEFKGTLPRDARYVATKVVLLYQDGIGAAREVKTYNGQNITNGVEVNLAAIRNARPGDKAYIQIEGIRRVNFQGQKVNESIPLADRTIPILLR